MVLQAGTAYEDEAGFVAKSVQRVADHPTVAEQDRQKVSSGENYFRFLELFFLTSFSQDD